MIPEGDGTEISRKVNKLTPLTEMYLSSVHKSGSDYSEVLTELGGEDGESLRAYVYLRVVVSYFCY